MHVTQTLHTIDRSRSDISESILRPTKFAQAPTPLPTLREGRKRGFASFRGGTLRESSREERVERRGKEERFNPEG